MLPLCNYFQSLFSFCQHFYSLREAIYIYFYTKEEESPFPKYVQKSV